MQGKSYKAKIIPFAPIKRFYTDNSLIVGDTAGFVRPGTGEGIYFAMLSGKFAAQTIIGKREFAWYEERCRKEFGKYLKPVTFGWNRFLLNKILAEDFFRLGYYKLGRKFLKNILIVSPILSFLK